MGAFAALMLPNGESVSASDVVHLSSVLVTHGRAKSRKQRLVKVTQNAVGLLRGACTSSSFYFTSIKFAPPAAP